MKDKEFDKSFSDKLNQDRHLPFNEKDWEQLSKRLDESDSIKASFQKGQNGYWRWLIPILLLLLGINGWMLGKMSKTQAENAVLTEEIKSVKSILEKQNNSVSQPQIIQKTDTIIVYKTVYKTLPQSLNQNNSVSATNSTPSVLPPVLSTNTDNVDINNAYNLSKAEDTQKVNTLNTDSKLPEIIMAKKEPFLSVNHLQGKAAPKMIPFNSKGDLIVLKSNSTIIKPAASTTNRFFVGWSYGLINYHTQWFNKDNIEFSRNEQSYQTGLKAEFAINNNWRLTATTDFCPYRFKINWMDSRYNLPNLPKGFYPSKHTVKTIEGSQQMFLGSFGVKYLFSGNIVRPYLGAAYSAMRINRYEAMYTYADTWNTLYYAPSALEKNVNITNIAHLQGGLEFKIHKNLLLQADGFYYKDINKIEKTFDLFGLRANVLYGF